jgi:uncharacterized membrane protein
VFASEKCVVISGIIFIIICEGLAVLVVKKVALLVFQQQPWVLHLLTNVVGVLVLLCNFVEAFVKTIA